jgi:hypothetical protein
VGSSSVRDRLPTFFLSRLLALRAFDRAPATPSSRGSRPVGGDSSANEKRDALKMLEDTLGVMRRVLGPQHPVTQRVQRNLHIYREQFRVYAHGRRLSIAVVELY